MQMVTEADLYANSDRTVPLAPLVVQTQGTYTFNASVTGTTSGSVVVTAKTPGVLLAKQTFRPNRKQQPYLGEPHLQRQCRRPGIFRVPSPRSQRGCLDLNL